jgi:hypothetical protein
MPQIPRTWTRGKCETGSFEDTVAALWDNSGLRPARAQSKSGFLFGLALLSAFHSNPVNLK